METALTPGVVGSEASLFPERLDTQSSKDIDDQLKKFVAQLTGETWHRSSVWV